MNPRSCFARNLLRDPANRFAVTILVLWANGLFAEGLQPLVLVDGKRVDATLTGCADGTLAFATATESKPVAMSEFVFWGQQHDIERGPLWVLRDGTQLVGDLVSMRDEELELATDLFGTILLRRTNVAGIGWQLPVEIVGRDRLVKQLLREQRDEDVMRLTNGDELTGKLAIRGLTAAGMPQFHHARSGAVVASDRLTSLAFASTPAVSSAALRVALRGGSVLAVTSLAESNAEITVKLPCGEKLTVEAKSLWPSVVGLQSLSPRCTYLSDLPHAGYKHVPFLTAAWPLGIDENVLGGFLRCRGRILSKGIGMHSTSRLAFDLAGKYHQLEADLAIDDSAGKRGSVVFRVFVDRTVADQAAKWEAAFTSPIVRGGDAPRPVSIDITAAQRMALVVEFAERGDEGDHANWLNARVR